MQTEKEINHIIDSHVGMTESMTRDLHNAAAAIAKRLSEGVVWEKILTVHKGGITGSPVLVDDKGYRYYPWWMGEELTVGERIEVTVKIVEGTKDES